MDDKVTVKKECGAYFPMFVSIEGKEGLIIGGGKTALGKVQHLLAWGPSLTVVAPEFCPELLDLAESLKQNIQNSSHKETKDLFRLIQREFSKEDIHRNLAFVIAASSDEQVNRLAASLCRKISVPVNVVDVPEESTFFFPSLVKRGRLVIGISTGGASPSAAIHVRRKIEQNMDDNIEEILDYLAQRRSFVKKSIKDEALRKRVFSGLFERCMELGRGLKEEEEEKVISYWRNIRKGMPVHTQKNY